MLRELNFIGKNLINSKSFEENRSINKLNIIPLAGL